MVFTIGKCGYFLEQVFIVFVGVEFRAVQNSSATSSSTSIAISRFSTFEFFDKIIYLFLCRFFKFQKLAINIIKQIRIVWIVPEFITSLMNLFIRNNNIIKIDFRKFYINILNSSFLIASSNESIVSTLGSGLVSPP